VIAPDGNDEELARRVGLAALAALVAVIAFFVFVFGHIDWGARVRVRVYFHAIGALQEGAPFVVGGRAIGKVEAIALVSHAPPLGGDDGVAVTVALDAREAARLDPSGDVFLASKGVLSDRYLELGPAPSPSPSSPSSPSSPPSALGLRDGQELVGRDPPSLDRVLQRTWNNLQDLGGFVEGIRPELDALRAQVAMLAAAFDPGAPSALPGAAEVAPLLLQIVALRDAIETLRTTGLGGDAGLAHLREVIDRAGRVVAQARATLAALDAGAGALRANLEAVRARVGASGQGAIAAAELAIDRVRADVAKLEPLLATVDAIRQSIARGEGSLLKLANDPEFPEDTKELGKLIKRHPWRVLIK
jgi:ABC-type transporter Mla subunit MlaD